MTKDEALDLAMEAIARSGDFLFNWHDCEPNNEHEMSRYQEVLAMNEKAFTAIKQARALDKMAENARELGLDYEPVPDPDYWPGTKPVQEPVAHCEAGPDYCQQCLKESPLTYGSEEIRKLREVIKSQANIIDLYESEYGKTSSNFLHGRKPEFSYGVSDSLVQVTTSAAPVQEDWGPGPHECHSLTAPVQEPVAWLVEFENGEQELHFDEQSVGETQAPLYTTPPAQTAPVQEPVAWWNRDYGSPVFAFKRDSPGIGLGNPDATPLYTTPPAAQRQWVRLTNEEIAQIYLVNTDKPLKADWLFARAIEAKLKEKNT